MTDLDAMARELRARHDVPGVGIGVLDAGRTAFGFAGVTSVTDPLPVDDRTLFQIGSITKTYTATAVMALVTQGRVGLEDRVRAHLPDLRLRDESVADRVRVRQLLNHTSGWDGVLTSGGDDPEATLAGFVARTLPTAEQIGPLGGRAEYNNAGVAVAGRLIEAVCGRPYELAVTDLLLEPLGLSSARFTQDDVATERVMVGHLPGDDARPRVARPWRWPRAANPEGGLISTLADQLAWARFHFGDGRSPDGTVVVAPDLLRLMRQSTVELVGNVMGEAIGLGWFLRTVAGEPTIAHQGTTNGQFAELRLVPGRELAVVVGTNGGPGGTRLVQDAVAAVLEQRAGLVDEPRPLREHDPALDGQVAGTFQNSLARLEVTVTDGVVEIDFTVRPERAAELGHPEFAPGRVRFLPGNRGEYLVVDGPFEGTTGSFAGDGAGRVTEVDFGGRWHRRVEPDG